MTRTARSRRPGLAFTHSMTVAARGSPREAQSADEPDARPAPARNPLTHADPLRDPDRAGRRTAARWPIRAAGAIRFRFAPLAVAVLVVQLALFSPLSDGLPEVVGRWIYVVSTGLVVLVVVANLGLPGLPVVLVGAASNLAAIVANGGAMPASASALAAVGLGVGGNTNSVLLEQPNLEPLTDIFATPGWLPLANVFSIGDVLIGAGVVMAIVVAMRRGESGQKPDQERPVTSA